MSLFFYLSSAVAVVATLMAMLSKQAVHALLYFILSLLALSTLLFDLGAPFAATLELIIYAGAIMVLFVFVVMLLNPARDMSLKNLIFPSLLFLALLGEFFWMRPRLAITSFKSVSTLEITTMLFQKYGVLVELASLILLAGLIAAYRIGKK